MRDQQIFLDKKDRQLKEAEKERDDLVVHNEAMGEKLKSNNIEYAPKPAESKAGSGPSPAPVKSGLIEQYKAKLGKA